MKITYPPPPRTGLYHGKLDVLVKSQVSINFRTLFHPLNVDFTYFLFYLRAIASPVNQAEFCAIPHNFVQFKNSCTQFRKHAHNSAKMRAIPRNIISIVIQSVEVVVSLTWNGKCENSMV